MSADPLAETCPTCDADAGEPCEDVQLGSHHERWLAAQEQIEEQAA